MNKIFGTLLAAALMPVWTMAAVDAADAIAVVDDAATGRGIETSAWPVGKLAQGTATTAATRAMASRGPSVKALSTVSDLAGDYVLSYSNYDESGYDGGNLVEISAVEGTDSILIDGFYDYAVKAKVDLSAMTISIPCSYLCTTDYGDVYLAYFDPSSLTYSVTAEMTGTIGSDGNITLSTGWGAIIVSGTYAGSYYLLCMTGSTIEKVNATMTYNSYDIDTQTTSTTTVKVVVTQENDSTVYVKNFYNKGTTIEINLYPSMIATIEKQYVYYNSTRSTGWYLVGAEFSSGYTSMSSYTPLVCDYATDYRTISWGQWSLIYTYGGYNYYSLCGVDCKIETEFDLTYPSAGTLQLSGDGTASSPYQIATVADWNTLVDYVSSTNYQLTGTYVKITADIDFGGDTIRPIGYDQVTYFGGDLDGDGHTISGYVAVSDHDYYGALATMTTSGACFHDITLAGNVIASHDFAGGAVGFLRGSVYNIVNTGTVTSDGGQVVGGIVGGTDEGSVVSGCCNKGTVTSNYYQVGGVAGRAWISEVKNCWNEGTVSSSYSEAAGVVAVVYSDKTGFCTVDSCWNAGTVTCSGTSSAFTAGVASHVYPGSYTNCWNEGTVTAPNSEGYVSGVFSIFYGTAYGNHVVMRNCYNTSDISGAAYVAGLVNYGVNSNSPMVDMYGCYNTGNLSATSGRVNGLANVYTVGGTYEGCYNTGNITVESSSAQYSSGLFGKNYGTTPKDTIVTTMTGCYNTGTVYATANQASGIVGYVYQYATIDSCYNTGDVTGNNYIGGITGTFYGTKTSRITNCWNSGNITSLGTSTSCGTGGIVGMNSTIDTITNCFNTGNVTATSQKYAGGIAGTMASVATNVYNTGDISAKTYAGGITGYKTSSHGALSNAYSTGSVTVTTEGSTYVGPIMVGTGTGLVSGCYYLSEAATGTGYDTVAVAMTRAELASLDMGDGWTAGDNYTYPRLTTLADVDIARVTAVQVFPADGDSLGTVTQSFYVGAADGVTWTASPDVVSVTGNVATFTASYTGTLTMTATSGDASASTDIDCDVVVSGVSDALGSAAKVVDEKFYSISGTPVARPAEDARAVYIVVKTYDDGTTATFKEAR